MNRSVVTVMRVKKINPITAQLNQAMMRSKTGPTLMAVARTAPLQFAVSTRSGASPDAHSR